MKIDLTCPIELWQYAMPVEDASECTFVLNNLSSKVVTSVMVILSCFDAENNLLFRQSERVQGLRAGVGERFNIMILPTLWKNVGGVDLSVEKVWFGDATIWRRGNGPLTSFTPNNLPNGRALDELRFVAGQDAQGYPVRQEHAWLCVCGRANPLDSMRCCRCERSRESVFASFSKENVTMVIAVHEQKLAEVAREAREENSRMAEEKAMEQQQRKRKRGLAVKLCATGVALAAACAATVIWIIPAARYGSAASLMRNGQFMEARAAFADMGDYRDAEVQLLECDYGEAVRLLEAGDEESILQSIEGFKALGDYRDSGELGNKAGYRLGQLYLENKLYDKAMDSFQRLGDYSDSAEMCNRCMYEQADELLQNGNESVALAIFTLIPHYNDASQKALACYYTMGQKRAEAGDNGEAARLFALAGDYEDAEEQYNSTVYKMASSKLELGDLEGAGLDFLSVAAYGDAQAKANDCLYQYAQSQMQQGAYEAAVAAFELVPDYLDSEGQVTAGRYQQAVTLMNGGDYANAVPLLEKAAGYDDADKLLNQCRYKLAQEAIAANDSETAERLLNGLGGYEDSAALLRTARYQAAENALNQQSYSEAMVRYETLGSYRDSADKLKLCQYWLARQSFESGDYAAAAERFTALGKYEDSAEWLENTCYQQAAAIEQAGDMEAALKLLPQVKGIARAEDKLTALLLNEGARLEKEGNLTAATELYQQLDDSGTAQERVSAVRYQMALNQKQNGDIKEAGAAFLQLGDYKDAAEQGRLCFEQLYDSQATAARQAMASEDYRSVILALREVDRTQMPESYADLAELYLRACYEYAQQLYRDGEPYKAMPFYREAAGYQDADDQLTRRVYLILGAWKSASGSGAEFKPDGTCEMAGKKLYFRLSNFSLYTGETPETMALSHRVSSLTKTGMSLRVIAEGKDYKFEKTGEAESVPMDLGDDVAGAPVLAETPAAAPSVSPSAPVATPTASPAATQAPSQEPDEFQVTED